MSRASNNLKCRPGTLAYMSDGRMFSGVSLLARRAMHVIGTH